MVTASSASKTQAQIAAPDDALSQLASALPLYLGSICLWMLIDDVVHEYESCSMVINPSLSISTDEMTYRHCCVGSGAWSACYAQW